MSKHTPGPWVVYELIDGYDIRSPEAECWVATASDPEAVWGAIGREEDARLIAAAPDLLEALVDFIKMFGADDDPRLIKLLNKTRAAITKAKGHTVRVNGGPQERHRCELHSQSGGHGEAVDVCFEDEDGKLWVENGEYASVVFYCPVCGYASRAKAKGEEHE
jgi:hypothetical protein